MNNQANLIEMHTKLNHAGYICPIDLTARVQVALNTKPVAGAFLFGQAGTGKSFLPETLSKIMDVEYLFYQCFPGTREDDLMLKMVPSEKTTSGIELYDGVITQAVKLTSAGKKVILALDEWDKTRPSADSFLLDFLQTGRINFNGFSGKANLENLYLFVTMNDERDLSEPLLRRLPKIDFKHHHPSLVKEALVRTHKGHQFIDSAVVLYERCLMANMPKPATIQELRQLLDAITVLSLEKQADWDMLVYQFVTKTAENHMLLKAAEDKELTFTKETKPELSPKKYEAGDQQKAIDREAPLTPKLPKLGAFQGHGKPIQPVKGKVDLGKSCGVVEYVGEAYDACVGLAGKPKDSPSEIGDFAEISNGNIINIKKPIPLSKLSLAEQFWGKSGEILVQDTLMTFDDVMDLRNSGIKIVSYSKKELLGKGEGVELRWKGGTLDVIVDLTQRETFMAAFKDIIPISMERHFAGKFYANCIAPVSGDKPTHYADFVKEPGYTVEKKKGIFKYCFDAVQFIFYVKDDKKIEKVGVNILKPVPEPLVKYISAWFPMLTMKHFVATDLTEDEAIKQGFKVEVSGTTQNKDGIDMVYKRGIIMLHKTMKDYTAEHINATIEKMDAIRKGL